MINPKFDINKKNPENLYEIIVEILKVYNCRISEILSAKWSNFFPDRFLILEGKKHSAPVIITDRTILKNISKLVKVDDQLIFKTISYHSIHHYIKSKYSHLFVNIKTKKYSKVTHAYRYLNLKSIDNDDFIKQILHHNSRKSGMYYKHKLKG